MHKTRFKQAQSLLKEAGKSSKTTEKLKTQRKEKLIHRSMERF
jgi:hypothetical protein